MLKTMQQNKLLIAGALFAASYTGSVQAISQAEPGEAILIPYMLYDSAKGINTLTGITIPSTLGNDPTQIEIGGLRTLILVIPRLIASATMIVASPVHPTTPVKPE